MKYFILIVLILAADRGTKLLITQNMSPGDSIAVIDGVFHISYIRNHGAAFSILQGQTLLLALYGLFFACIIGLIVGIMSVVKNKFCRGFALVFVNLIRGVPMIVLAYFIFFGVPFLFNNVLHVQNRVTLTALQAGSICLALNCGAYMAEIIRAGIQSVDIGQMEAARSVGLPYWRAMQRVVLPQAIRTMIPSIINQFIITLKDTSILSVIGFPELVNTAKNVVAETFLSFQTWGIVAIMYLIVILLLQWLAKVLERRLKYESK